MKCLVATAFVALAVSGCGAFDPPPPPAPFKAVVSVTGDPHQPLAGVPVSTGKGSPRLTDTNGKVELVLGGQEGEVREVGVTCPPGHQQASGALQIRLTRLIGTSAPEYSVSCPPLRRKVVVAVRADNGPYLPVKYLNNVVATTDASGAAHFAIEIEPGTLALTLDTTERRDLKPPSPTLQVAVGQQDDIHVVSQFFEVEKKKVIIYKPHVATELRRGTNG